MTNPLGLFQAYGIEIELMIVDSKSLNVKPVADTLLTAAAGELVSDFQDGDITWSNELVTHVIEFKTTGPAPSLDCLEASFYRSQRHAQQLLAQQGARLMPTGMHPWMNPETETVLWPHDNNEIYSLYDKIFDCRGHGWSNLQSVHINLPFANEDEFRRLHSAIRAVLPIIPALSASSPICDSAVTGIKDARLSFYETNQQSVPIIAGDIIPEPVASFADYRDKISNPIQAAIRPFDSEGLLEGDWLNSRGAIARIDRNAIEIRLLDTQECAHTNIAIVQLVCATIQSLVSDDEFLKKADALDTRSLRAIWKSCVTSAESALITDDAYLALFTQADCVGRSNRQDNNAPSTLTNGDIAFNNAATLSQIGADTPFIPRTADPSQDNGSAAPSTSAKTAAELWRAMLNRRVKPARESSPSALKVFDDLLSRPSLATRIEIAAGNCPTRERLHQIYEKLCDCLDKNEVFDPESLKSTETNDGPEAKPKTSREKSDSVLNV